MKKAYEIKRIIEVESLPPSPLPLAPAGGLLKHSSNELLLVHIVTFTTAAAPPLPPDL